MVPHPHSLGHYLLHERRRLAVSAVLVALAVGVAVGIPFILRYALDGLIDGRLETSTLVGAALAYGLAHILSGSLAFAMRRQTLSVGYDVEARVREDMFDHLTSLDPAFYRRERVGDIMTKLSSDLQSVREFVAYGLLHGWRTLLGFVAAFAVMFAMDVPMALVMLLLLPLISATFFRLLLVIRRRYESVQEQYSAITSFAQESLAGIRTLKGFGIEDRQQERFDGLNQEHMKRHLALSRVDRPIFSLMSLFFGIAVALLLVVGGHRVVHGHMTAGELVQFNQYLFFLRWPMLALGWTVNLFQRGKTSWQRIRTVLDAKPDMWDAEQTDRTLTAIRGDIQFRDVTLRYGNRSVLKHIDLTIPEGSTLGITGPTGSGKSQLAAMIARLAEPTLGSVHIGEHDVREYPLQVLRSHIAMAPQEPFLFSDTIARNIDFGLVGEPNVELVEWAAEIAQLRRDVNSFPGGFNTVLGERGVTLSGGQRQRTAISRALVRDASILILDDVFSAIDTQTESMIHQELGSILEKRTCIIISHRISSLRHADHIVVLEGGHLTQQGTHAELVAQPGYYQQLDELQRLEARLEADV